MTLNLALQRSGFQEVLAGVINANGPYANETRSSGRPKPRGDVAAESNVHLSTPSGRRPNSSSRAPTRNPERAVLRLGLRLLLEAAEGAGSPPRRPSPHDLPPSTKGRRQERRVEAIFFRTSCMTPSWFRLHAIVQARARFSPFQNLSDLVSRSGTE